MRNPSHYVVTTDREAAVSLTGVRAYVAGETPLPSTVVQWGCAGPWVLAWGNVAATRRALPPSLFAADPEGLGAPRGSWFKRRRGP